MSRIFTRLSLRQSMYLAVLTPLIIMVLLGAALVEESYSRFTNEREVLAVQKLANAGGELAQALPGEIFSPADQVTEARARSDAAFATLFKLYDDYVASGGRDDVISVKVDFIKSMLPKWEEFRAKAAAVNFQLTLPLRNSAIALQPIAGAGIDITNRAGAHVDDADISRLILGYHALMEISDAGLMELGTGTQYLAGSSLDPLQKRFLIVSSTYFATFSPVAFEQLPTLIMQPYREFLESADYQFVEEKRKEMYELGDPKEADSAASAKWNQITGVRAGLMTRMITQARAYLDQETLAKYNDALSSLERYSALTLGAGIGIVLLSISLTGRIAGILRQLGMRMTSLANGDTTGPVPSATRRDEIGEMARAVEHFRQSAIDNSRLQAEAEGLRNANEVERAQIQRAAKEEADRRLKEATGSLASAMKRLASGDMLCEVNDAFAPEFEGLRQDFNASVLQLREALSTVGRLAAEVDGDSTDISRASSNFAKRTEQQATSLEETAAALEEITEIVSATTRRTSDARDIVHAASSKAVASAAVVRNAVEAMQGIERSSRQINQIIGVIDEIAFQTNLLALNAGVEAARAGDAGKGFAVVAQEVRELAQRSASAAKEIKQLISTSAAAVNEGVKLVNDTGAGLSEIEKLVLEVNKHMNAIAAAAQEQASGLAQVNSEVNHMNQATQQNAAMVEEMNGATIGLISQSNQLRQLLSRFQVGRPQTEADRRTAFLELSRQSMIGMSLAAR